MKIWKRRAAGQETAAGPVQLRGSERQPGALIDGYVPLHEPAFGLYRAIREAVPVVDAALLKLVRLAGGVHITCADKGLEKRLAEFCGRCRWGGTRWASRHFWTAIWTVC